MNANVQYATECRLLSENGCDVNQIHSLGWTALHVAAMNDSVRYCMVSLHLYKVYKRSGNVM